MVCRRPPSSSTPGATWLSPMTGSNARRWTWLPSLTIPAAVAVAEATWASLLVSAAVNGSPGVHVHLPFLAVALPSVAAAALAAWTARFGWRWWRRYLVLALIVLVGLSATAGLISELNLATSGWRAAIRPWTIGGHPPAAVAGAAWFVAIAAWGRGTWLGIAPPSFRHAVRSVVVGAV